MNTCAQPVGDLFDAGKRIWFPSRCGSARVVGVGLPPRCCKSAG